MKRRELYTGLALLSAGLIGGAVVGELALRIWVRVGGTVAQRLDHFDPGRIQVEPFGTAGYRQKPFARIRYANGAVANANSMGYRGPETTRSKPAGIERIVLLGGSTSHGWGVNDHETIDAYMRAELERRAPGRFEVINAAFDGHDSWQQFERLRSDVLRLDPDVIIISSGINDVRNARYQHLTDADPRTLIWRAPMEQARRDQLEGPSLWSRAKHHSLLLRLPAFVMSQVRATSDVDTTTQAYPDAADYFERNLRRIARITVTHDIRLILSTPPSSLRTRYAASAPPEKAYWITSAEVTATYRDTLAARMRRIADDPALRGHVRYVRPEVPAAHFLDDAHLTAEGNAHVAAAFVDAVLTFAPSR